MVVQPWVAELTVEGGRAVLHNQRRSFYAAKGISFLMRPVTHRIPFLAVLVIGACRGPSDRASGLRISTDSSDRYPVVRSLGVAPTRSTQPLVVIGGTGGPAEFGSIRSVLLAGDGSVYVADPSYRVVSIFDSAGRLVRQLGREGAGPGEYRDPYSLAWLGQGIALLDPGNSRIGLYDSAGHWTKSWIVQRISGSQFIRLYRTPPTFWSYGLRPAGAQQEGIFIQYTRAGPTDTLTFIRPSTGLAKGRVCHRPDKGITFFSAPFGPVLLEIPTPGARRAPALSTSYRIAFVNAQGDTIRAIERQVPPAPISDEEWEEANADWIKFRKDWPTASCDHGEFERPEFKPPLAFLFYDDIGQLWVELTTPEGPRYDVFDSEGRLLVSVTGLPSTEGVDPSVAGHRIAFVGRDSADAPVVRIFRVVPEHE